MGIDLFNDIINPLKKQIEDVTEIVIKEADAKVQYYSQSGNNVLSAFFDTGASAEYNIYKIVSRLSEGNYCLANCYIPKDDGTTSEIDVILVDSTGIYVFESKNYKGYIFGSETSRQWTVTLNGGRRGVQKYHFYNPIMQNKTHINWLRKYLNTDVPINSYIVFGNRCEFKDVPSGSSGVRICHANQLRNMITSDMQLRTSLLTEVQMSTIHYKLDKLCHKNKIEKAIHVDEIKEKSNKVASGICPRCGGQLVLRTAKTGTYAGNQFYGCSNYPRCKFIANK